MDDPELHGDEQILIRTQGVHVKSISFEAILTNKRIILIDRIKNILPPKEIPLATIQSIEAGENAIRDLVISLAVITKTGGTRQMVLTFSRDDGGNRIKERDEWVRQIRAHLAPSFEQVVRKVMPPGPEPLQNVQRAQPPAKDLFRSPPAPVRPVSYPPSSKKIVERPLESQKVPVPSPAPSPENILGTYCTKCGTKVPEGSSFCNKCGTRIVRAGETSPASVSAPAPATPALPPRKAPQVRMPASGSATTPTIVPPATPYPDQPRRVPVKPPVPEPVYAPPITDIPAAPRKGTAPTAKKGFLPRLFSPKAPPQPPRAPKAGSRDLLPPKQPRNKKKIVLGIVVIVIILIAVVAVVVVLPKTGLLKPSSSSNSSGSGSSSATTTAVTATTTTKSTSASASTTIVIATQTPVAIPSTGVDVYVNYIGGWKGTYGMSDDLQQKTSSGERIMEVENATGMVTATIMKMDSSTHELTVSIYKDGTVLTTGSTTAGNGKVALSVDVTTGAAQTPVVS